MKTLELDLEGFEKWLMMIPEPSRDQVIRIIQDAYREIFPSLPGKRGTVSE